MLLACKANMSAALRVFAGNTVTFDLAEVAHKTGSAEPYITAKCGQKKVLLHYKQATSLVQAALKKCVWL